MNTDLEKQVLQEMTGAQRKPDHETAHAHPQRFGFLRSSAMVANCSREAEANAKG
jgi:hypothetical protein